MKSILFISHDASRTGAPIVFLNFLKWLRLNTNVHFVIILREGGELENEFCAIAPTFVLDRSSMSRSTIANELIAYDIGLIFSNTAVNGDILELLNQFECPVISYIHELEHVITTYCGIDNFRKVKEYTDQYIAASFPVKENLVLNHGIEKERIEIINEGIPLVSRSPGDQLQIREELYLKFGIPKNALIVGGCGTISWRKGTDLLIQVASIIRQNKNDDLLIHFVWIGGLTEGSYFGELLYDIKKLELQPFFHFLGLQSDALSYLSILDVFVLPSREDAFPLVCLEASSLGKPIVCFRESGGIHEHVGSDCGFAVSYLDLMDMASKILGVLEDQDLRIRLGSNGKSKVMSLYSIDKISKEIICLIQRHYSSIGFENNLGDPNALAKIFGEQMKSTTSKLDKSQSQLQESQSQLQESQSQLQESQSQLQESQSQLQESQSQLQESQSQLQWANVEIETMAQTKLWKLRKKWLKFRSMVF